MHVDVFILLHPMAFIEAMDNILCYYSGVSFFGYSHNVEDGLQTATSTCVVTTVT